MKKLSLRPYPGEVRVFKSLNSLLKNYEKKSGKLFHECAQPQGKMLGFQPEGKPWCFFVWGATKAQLAHEFAHVLLVVFKEIGSDPCEGGGEPFCYMLSQLMIDAEGY